MHSIESPSPNAMRAQRAIGRRDRQSGIPCDK
jgi:hypothetical protein